MKRPWGMLDWVLSRYKSNDKKWKLIGCLSSETRCTSVLAHFDGRDALKLSPSFLDITDHDSEYYQQAADNRVVNEKFIYENYGYKDIFEQMDLLISPAQIKDYTANIISESPHIILDISSFPKRFFFPMIQVLMSDPRVEDLIVTYTAGDKYHDGDLALNHQSTTSLGGFMGDSDFDSSDQRLPCIILGVGLEPVGLDGLLDSQESYAETKLLFPFSDGISNNHRNWEFVRRFSLLHKVEPDDVIRVHSLDVSSCFDHINRITIDDKKYKAIFAPYGPKPHSLAMCLYAILNNSRVVYSQPRSYHPNYTSGARMVDGKPDTKAYVLKMNKVKLY